MRLMCVFLAIATLAACESEPAVREVPTTTSVRAAVASPPTTSTSIPASTTTSATEDGDPGEAIGVTDKVTILITDPEDG